MRLQTSPDNMHKKKKKTCDFYLRCKQYQFTQCSVEILTDCRQTGKTATTFTSTNNDRTTDTCTVLESSIVDFESFNTELLTQSRLCSQSRTIWKKKNNCNSVLNQRGKKTQPLRLFHKTNDIIWLFFPHHYAIFRVLTLFTPFPLHLPLPASPGSYIALQTSSFFKFGACVTLSQKPQITPLQQQWIRNNFVLAIKNRREERARERSKGKIQLSCSRDHQRRRRAIGVSNSLGGRVVQGTPPQTLHPSSSSCHIASAWLGTTAIRAHEGLN